MPKEKMVDNKELEVRLEDVKKAEKQLESVNADIASAEERLAEIRKGVAAFDEMNRTVEGYKHRFVKLHDLDNLEAKVSEIETRLTKVEKKGQ